jgi:hypothetical protein
MAQESWHKLGKIEVVSGAVAVCDAGAGLKSGCVIELPNGTYEATSHALGRAYHALYIKHVGVEAQVDEGSVLGQTWSDAALITIADSATALGGKEFSEAFDKAYLAKDLPRRGRMVIDGYAIVYSRTGYDHLWDINPLVTEIGERAGVFIAF